MLVVFGAVGFLKLWHVHETWPGTMSSCTPKEALQHSSPCLASDIAPGHQVRALDTPVPTILLASAIGPSGPSGQGRRHILGSLLPRRIKQDQILSREAEKSIYIYIWCSAARPPLPPPPHGIPPPPCGSLWCGFPPCPSPLWLRSAAPPSMAIAGWASGVRLLRVWTLGCDTVPTCPELQSQ